jgi:uracil-DNA glycosylase
MTLTSHCSRCPRRRPIVQPCGPIPCPILFLGEQPAKDEDKWGTPFVGKTGQEFDHTYLPLSNLPRSSIFIMNSRLCSTADYSNPEPIDADSCMSLHFGPILSQVKPVIIVPMGAIACSLWSDVKLSLHHGIPREAKFGPWHGILFPTHHPSAGMRKTGYMVSLMQDFNELGKLIRSLDLSVT